MGNYEKIILLDYKKLFFFCYLVISINIKLNHKTIIMFFLEKLIIFKCFPNYMGHNNKPTSQWKWLNLYNPCVPLPFFLFLFHSSFFLNSLNRFLFYLFLLYLISSNKKALKSSTCFSNSQIIFGICEFESGANN